MGLLERFSKKNLTKLNKEVVDKLVDYFLEKENAPNGPLNQAIVNYENLEQHCPNEKELLFILMEESIYCSLYVTFFESLLSDLKAFPQEAEQLIQNFVSFQQQRENIILSQGQSHANYILNNGQCLGCECCDHHKDVHELLNFWQAADLSFFIRLYIGIQAIQITLEDLLQEVLPGESKFIQELNADNILTFRKYIFDYVQQAI